MCSSDTGSFCRHDCTLCMQRPLLTAAFRPPRSPQDVSCLLMWTWFTCHSIPSFHVLMLCRKYKSTLKFCYEKKKKKMGFVKIKKNIFSRTGLTGSLSPQRASRLFALPLSSISVRRCAIPVSAALPCWPCRRPAGGPATLVRRSQGPQANTLIRSSASVYIRV